MKKLGILVLAMVFVFGISAVSMAEVFDTDEQQVKVSVTEDVFVSAESADFGADPDPENQEENTVEFTLEAEYNLGAEVYIYVTDVTGNTDEMEISITADDGAEDQNLVVANEITQVDETIAFEGSFSDPTAEVELNSLTDTAGDYTVEVTYTLSESDLGA